MHVDVSGHHTTLTPALRTAIEQKLSKLDQHTNEPTKAEVVITVEKNHHLIEATLLVNGTPHHAQAKAPNMYAALDRLESRLSRSMRKEKTKRMQRQRGHVKSLKHYAEASA